MALVFRDFLIARSPNYRCMVDMSNSQPLPSTFFEVAAFKTFNLSKLPKFFSIRFGYSPCCTVFLVVSFVQNIEFKICNEK